MFNKYSYIKSIGERKLNSTNVGNILGLSRQSVSYKVNGRVDWSLSEIQKLRESLRLTDKEIIEIFFAKKTDTKNI